MIRVFPWLSGKKCSCQCRRHRRLRYDPCIGKIPWRRKQQPTPVFLPGKSHRQRSLAGYSPWGHKKSDMTECTHTHTHILIHINVCIYMFIYFPWGITGNRDYHLCQKLQQEIQGSQHLRSTSNHQWLLNVIEQREKYTTERRKYICTLTHTHMNICVCTYAHMHI